MGREIVNLDENRSYVVPKRDYKPTKYHKKLVEEINEIAETKKLERQKREENNKKIRQIIIKAIIVFAAIIILSIMFFSRR